MEMGKNNDDINKTICDACVNKRNMWSEELREEYRGCTLLMQEDYLLGDIVVNIKAKLIGTGWITSGAMAFNKQLITKDVSECKYFVER